MIKGGVGVIRGLSGGYLGAIGGYSQRVAGRTRGHDGPAAAALRGRQAVQRQCHGDGRQELRHRDVAAQVEVESEVSKRFITCCFQALDGA